MRNVKPIGLFIAWLAAPEAHGAALDLNASWVEAFQRDGYGVLPGFATDSTTAEMKRKMAELIAANTALGAEEKDVFVTDDRQSDAQAKSRHFFESAEGVHFFYEEDGETLNKVGHCLHCSAGDVFGEYARSPGILRVLESIGLRAPALPQSMYIFKGARRGGAVTSHQDATFLHTTPDLTVIGLWLALDEATQENGCLWLRNGSHREPLRRRFARDDGPDRSMLFIEEDEGSYMDERILPLGLRVGAAAAAWEGTAVDAAGARALGFTPVPVAPGTLVVVAGTLDHLSLPNASPESRHTFQLHAIEGPEAGVQWSSSNWLQYENDRPFLHLAPRQEAGSGEL